MNNASPNQVTARQATCLLIVVLGLVSVGCQTFNNQADFDRDQEDGSENPL